MTLNLHLNCYETGYANDTYLIQYQ